MDQYTKQLVLDINLKKDKVKTDLANIVANIGKSTTDSFGRNLSSGIEAALDKSAIGKILGKGINSVFTGKNAFASILDESLNQLSKLFKDSLTELNNMLDASKLSNASTRSMMFGYGLSQSEAYGMNKALSAVGLGSVEDLYYANEQETAQFREAFEKYTAHYNQLAESGFFKDLQEYQYEMNMFNEEMKQSVIKFMIENKDTIVKVMQGLIRLSEGVLTFIGQWLPNIRGSSEVSAATSDIMNKYSSSNTSVQFYNNFNGVTKDDAQWIANSNELAYEQFIRSINIGD